MPKTVIYNGPDINLGRHGLVSKGQLISMTDEEIEGVAGDRRFFEASPEILDAAVKREAEAKLKQTAAQAKKDEAARAEFDRRLAEENGTSEPVAPASSEAPATPAAHATHTHGTHAHPAHKHK